MNLRAASVIVVDDEPDLLEIFGEWLLDAGCLSVTTAGNGADGLTRCLDGDFDLLISDVNMPVMDGLTMLRNLRAHDRSIPSVIFVSGFDGVTPEEIKALGISAFLAKPVHKSDFLATAECALAER